MLKIVSKRYTFVDVSVDALEPGVLLELGFILLEGDVFVVLVQVLAAVAEIDHEYLVGLLLEPHQEVLRINVVVGELLGVHPLDPVDQLIHNHQHRLQAELALAEFHQLRQIGPVDVGYQRSIVVLHPVPVQIGDTSATLDSPVDLGLPLQLVGLGIAGLEFDGELFLGVDVVGQVDLGEGRQADTVNG